MYIMNHSCVSREVIWVSPRCLCFRGPFSTNASFPLRTISKNISFFTVKHYLAIVGNLRDIVSVIVESHVAHKKDSSIWYAAREFAES